MNEIVFLVEQAPEGGFTARAIGESIFTQSDSLETLREAVGDPVRCHLDPGKGPDVLYLQDFPNDSGSAPAAGRTAGPNGASSM